MKIAINLLPYTQITGIETYVSNMVQLLIDSYPELEFVIISHSKTPPTLTFKSTNVKNVVYNLPQITRGKIAFMQQTLIYKDLLKHSPDFLISFSPSSPFFYKKTILYIHDTAYDRHPEERHSVIPFLYLKIMLFLSKYYFQKIITDSEFSKKEIKRFYKVRDEKIKVIHCGPPLLLQEQSVKNDFFRKDLANHPYLFYVGSTRPRKNLINLLDSFKIFSKNFPEYKLVLAGKKDKRFLDIENEVKKRNLKNYVLQTDFITDKEKTSLMSNAAALTFPSYYEGFGLPILEAQSLGLPVLTSNISSLPEVAGKGALYVDPYDVRGIAKGMEKVATDTKLRKKLVEEGHNNVKRFSWEKAAKELVDLFKELKNEDTRNN